MLKNQTYLPYPNISLFIIYLLYIKKLEGQNHASIKDIKESNNSTQMSFQQRGIAILYNGVIILGQLIHHPIKLHVIILFSPENLHTQKLKT